MVIDFRRDTITRPSREMKKAAFEALLGDAVYGEDPDQEKLEKISAEITGKEQALFVPSGTMGNLIALLSHTQRGGEIILEENAHIRTSETGSAAALAGLMLCPSSGNDGLPENEIIEQNIRKDNIHYPKTSLICLETSHYRYGGIVPPLKRFREIREIAGKYNIPIHLDGARLFNAAIYLGVEAREITMYTDSVMFCLSKGLGAPVGSMLCGTKSFITKAIKYRKMLGGGMRQTGWLCRSGIVALSRKNIALLKIDHENAQFLTRELNSKTIFNVNTSNTHTNFVDARFTLSKEQILEFIIRLKKEGILINPPKKDVIRFVISKEIDRTDIQKTISLIASIREYSSDNISI